MSSTKWRPFCLGPNVLIDEAYRIVLCAKGTDWYCTEIDATAGLRYAREKFIYIIFLRRWVFVSQTTR